MVTDSHRPAVPRSKAAVCTCRRTRKWQRCFENWWWKSSQEVSLEICLPPAAEVVHLCGMSKSQDLLKIGWIGLCNKSFWRHFSLDQQEIWTSLYWYECSTRLGLDSQSLSVLTHPHWLPWVTGFSLVVRESRFVLKLGNKLYFLTLATLHQLISPHFKSKRFPHHDNCCQSVEWLGNQREALWWGRRCYRFPGLPGPPDT